MPDEEILLLTTLHMTLACCSNTAQAKLMIFDCYCLQVGWFLHTPFPSSEIYRTLPVREEVLRAVLKADLIGFHTYDYARHFVSACTRILGLEVWQTAAFSLCAFSCTTMLAEAT